MLELRHRLAGLLLALAVAGPAAAADAAASPTAPSADPALERQVMVIAAELRCLVCQNQTIADSHADLAVDLRRQIREMLTAGRSEREVLDFMSARYGDFVLYRPPLKASTALLWLGPALLLVLGAATLVVVLRRRRNLPDEAFEAELPDATDDSASDGRR